MQEVVCYTACAAQLCIACCRDPPRVTFSGAKPGAALLGGAFDANAYRAGKQQRERRAAGRRERARERVFCGVHGVHLAWRLLFGVRCSERQTYGERGPVRTVAASAAAGAASGQSRDGGARRWSALGPARRAARLTPRASSCMLV